MRRITIMFGFHCCVVGGLCFLSMMVSVLGGTILEDAPFQTLQFTPNVTHRTDLCDRQLLMRLGSLEFKDVLRGKNLSVALVYIEESGYMNYEEERRDFDVSNPGYWITILDELARRAGFEWRNSYGFVMPPYINDSFRLQPNATVTDLLLWAVNVYDFSFSEWDRTVDRMKLGVNFPAGFTDTSTILIANRNSEEDEKSFYLLSFLRPFNGWVWISIVLTVFVTGLIYRIVHKTFSIRRRLTNDSDDDDQNHVHGENIFYSAMAVTGHVQFEPSTHGERIIVFSVCFWSLIIVSTYTANLASVMISKQQPKYPASSLAEAEHKAIPICVAKDYSIATKIKKNYPQSNLIEVNELGRAYELLKEGKCSLVADAASRFEVTKRNQTVNGDCALEWIGRAEDISSGGPASIVDAGILCTSLVGHVIEFYMKEMAYDGFIENAFQQFLDSTSSHVCPGINDSGSDDVDEAALTMVDMGGIFVTHGIACAVALLVSLFQRWFSKTHRSRPFPNQSDEVRVAESNLADNNTIVLNSRKIISGGY